MNDQQPFYRGSLIPLSLLRVSITCTAGAIYNGVVLGVRRSKGGGKLPLQRSVRNETNDDPSSALDRRGQTEQTVALLSPRMCPSLCPFPIPSHLSSVRFRSGRTNNNFPAPSQPKSDSAAAWPSLLPCRTRRRADCEYERASERGWMDGWMDNGAVSNCLEGGREREEGRGKVVGDDHASSV